MFVGLILELVEEGRIFFLLNIMIEYWILIKEIFLKKESFIIVIVILFLIMLFFYLFVSLVIYFIFLMKIFNYNKRMGVFMNLFYGWVVGVKLIIVFKFFRSVNVKEVEFLFD